MFSILIAAVILGVMIALTNDGDFPSWEIILICLAAAVLPSAICNFALPGSLFFVGPLVGAVCCAVAISLTLGMPLARAAFSAAMYFAAQFGLALLFA